MTETKTDPEVNPSPERCAYPGCGDLRTSYRHVPPPVRNDVACHPFTPEPVSEQMGEDADVNFFGVSGFAGGSVESEAENIASNLRACIWSPERESVTLKGTQALRIAQILSALANRPACLTCGGNGLTVVDAKPCPDCSHARLARRSTVQPAETRGAFMIVECGSCRAGKHMECKPGCPCECPSADPAPSPVIEKARECIECGAEIDTGAVCGACANVQRREDLGL
jgi:hypothetical protein